ncbi:unnamed protein product [Rodentolepis nana]|uniref:Rab-GAP TBC domain-containing protein n=1 Tax=Rodentolepis nana TaxID=102285 RepID=A0A0R3TVC0_RODNA|nr:unnamed protein product [Rodentolepis nana]
MEESFALNEFESVVKRLPEPHYSSSFSKYLPSLPLPAKPEVPSSLFAIVNKNAEHPPLISQFTLTQLAPFKNQKFHRPPSQNIGSNFSPAAATLRLNCLSSQSIRLKDVGAPKSKRLKNGDNSYIELEQKPDRPRSPDSQMKEMKKNERMFRWLNGEPSERDMERYAYYVENGVPDQMVADPPRNLWLALRDCAPRNLMDNWSKITQDLLKEIHKDYRVAVKKSIGWFISSIFFIIIRICIRREILL